MHTNQLIHSQSPYLLQHAHNPVNWNMWNDEILEKAKQENKPILVSIGYSSCHWCHVMEKESFENEATAAIMNEHFINIKIDREERPDLDHIYMDAVQAMTGSGGWPLNVFLTPNLKPFYGGTYFPPIQAHGRMSWNDTLIAVSKAFKERNEDIESQAKKLTQHINDSNSFAKKMRNNDDEINKNTLIKIADNLLKNSDSVWGGFGNAPKFPQTMSIQYLLRQHHYLKTKNVEKEKLDIENSISGKNDNYENKYLQQATLSLDKMIMGGLYDQMGGGFARYSTDEMWFAPHFEKMLYDNALLVSVLSEAYQITKKELYKETIAQTLDFIEREMMSHEYGFYSALDADSEGVEGKFYTWSKKEIEDILKEDAQLFCSIYNVEGNGNWEHTNILWLTDSVENFAKANGIQINFLKNKIGEWQKILLEERTKRIRPLLDDKCLCSWNALMNIAYSKAYVSTSNSSYKDLAIKNMDFILNNFLVDNELHHCFKNKAYNSAFAEDYAYLIEALIQLQEITGEVNYLLKAKELLDYVIENFSEENGLFFYFTPKNQKNIIAQKVEVYDGATPSANAVLCKCLQYLSVVFDDEKLRKRYQLMLQNLSPAIVQYPTSFGVWASLLQNEVEGLNEIIVLNADATTVSSINQVYIPNKILINQQGKSTLKLPIVSFKKDTQNIEFHLCINQTCFPPENDINKFLLFFNN